MSRLSRYKKSLAKFIKDRSCISKEVPNANMYQIIYNYIKNSDLILSITLLTTMNNQNKKNNISCQGYYAAAGIELMLTLITIIEDKNNFTSKYGAEYYSTTINFITLCIYKTFCQNLESVKNGIKDDKLKCIMPNIYTNVMSVINNKLSYACLLSDHVFEFTNKKPKNDTLNWYLQENKLLVEEFNKLKQISKDSMDKFIKSRIGAICEVSICIGWYMGCGNERSIRKIRKLAHSLAMLYKISNDFETIEQDIMNHNNGVSTNYVVNYGLQKAYEDYLDNKQKFIEGVMVLDMYTNTVKEIINYIDQKVDNIIDQTSPDLKSSYSAIQ
uniref:Uncharacterized protein n=1 Tax=Mimivirus LCMiAC01 TaxID=2506608 RepID=A0A481YZ67_9VIRU|nr:MAG: hypothetical protein LCMiAC01_02200 [Mimivirus LCMiAC01]